MSHTLHAGAKSSITAPACSDKDFPDLHATVMEQQTEFDPSATLQAIKTERAERKHRRTWGKSRLAKYRAELVKLKKEGASLGDLVFWLRKEKRVKVERTTVMRYLAKLPELSDGESQLSIS